jgi:hypothetical protein
LSDAEDHARQRRRFTDLGFADAPERRDIDIVVKRRPKTRPPRGRIAVFGG